MADNKHRFSWQVLMGDGLLLLCALTGFTGSFLSLYGDPDVRWFEATALDRCAANGDLLLIYTVLFGLTTLAVWSLPRWRGGLAVALAALLVGITLRNRIEVAQGAGVTLREVTALFSSRVGWGRVFPYETELLPAQEAAAVQLFFQLMLAGLALLLGWAVVRSRRWWMVIALTLPPLLPGLLADLYPDWPPFMALAACWCAMLLTSLCRWAAPDRRGKLTLITLPAVALALALITVLFPREGYTRPAWARKAEDGLMNLGSHLSDYLPNWNDSPFKSTVTYVGAAEEADLAHAGPLNYTGRTVLRVISDYDGWMYLRGSSLAVYEDGVWKALPNGTYEAYKAEHELELSPLYLPAVREQDGPVHTATVDNVGAVGACVYAPYFLLPQDVEETGMLPVEDAYLARRQGQWTHTMTFVERRPQIGAGDERPGKGSGETVVVFTGGPSPARFDMSAYAEYVYDNYLDVPEDLRETLELYGMMWFSVQATYYSSPGAVPPVQLAEAFGSFLQTFCEYDDSAPAAPEGVDPVYYFLTDSRRGYCMHYASAVTLMLRAAGIPARYVSGFAAEIPRNRQADVPDRAAHAWVEVWLDGFGWYPVEVTPDDAFAWARQSGIPGPDDPFADTPEPVPDSTEPPEPTDDPDQPTVSPSENGSELDGPGQGGPGSFSAALLSVFKGAVFAAAVVFLVWSVQFSVKRLRARRMAGTDTNRSALVCYNYLCRLERWGGKMDARAVELAQKARFSQHTLTQEELSLLRGLVDRERTRLCVVSSLPKRLLCRYLWGMPKVPVPLTDPTPPKREG